MTERAPELDERIDTYLDGAMNAADAVSFERALAEPEVYAAYRESLGLREMLRRVGPEVPPPGLENRIEAVIGFVPRTDSAPANRETGRLAEPARNVVASPWRSAIGGFAWSVRGPAIMVEAPAAGAMMARSRDPWAKTTPGGWTGTVSGITTTTFHSAGLGFRSMRWMLGPLTSSAAAAKPSKPARKRPWWEKALQRGLRLGG